MKNQLNKGVMLAVLATMATSAFAEKAGTMMAKVGVTNIVPQDVSGDLSTPSFPGTKINAGSKASLGGGLVYMLTDNVSLELPIALPFKHNIDGDGAINYVGSLGTVKSLPATVFAQYRFSIPDTTPYIGLGATYAYFYGTKGSAGLTALTGGTVDATTGAPLPTYGLPIDSKFAVTPQVGMAVRITDQTFLDFMYSKTFLTTKARLSTGQIIKARLDPDMWAMQIGYKF